MHTALGSLHKVRVAVRHRGELVGEALLMDERTFSGRRIVGQVLIRFDWCEPSFGRMLPRIWRGTEHVVIHVDLEPEEGEPITGCEIAHAWKDPIGPVRTVWFQLRHPDL